MKRSLVLYLVLISSFIFLIALVIDAGNKAHKRKNPAPVEQNFADKKPGSQPILIDQSSIAHQVTQNIKSPLGLLLLQILVILIVAKLFGFLVMKVRQPSVVGEMIAGIVLGPSVVGLIFPEFSEFLFPKNSVSNLQFLSQMGLAFFMFIIGMELNVDKLKSKAHSAVVISHASIIFPYFLGVSISYFLYDKFAAPTADFTSFALFIGIAVSITAFPVLARILQERKLTNTDLGSIAITCAAFDDVTAWCILATVVAIAKAGSLAGAVFTIFLSLVFVLAMLLVIKPMLKKVMIQYNDQNLGKMTVVLVFVTLLFSAWTTEAIGIHALFGAFLAGVIMPKEGNIKKIMMEKIEDVSVLLLLPLFFVFTGLRTQISLLSEGSHWATFGLVLLVAVAGKFGGSTLAAKLTKQSWKDSLSIGALMNTRGLMELIVLNIGYDLGILSPALFAIMVLMALVTTFMTGPLLDAIEFASSRRQKYRTPNTEYPISK